MSEEELAKIKKHADEMANLEVNLIYDFCNCIDILLYDVEHRYALVQKEVKREKKQAFNRMAELGRAIHHHAEVLCDGDMMEAYNGDWNCVDRRRGRANEYIRTLLTYIEKCGANTKNYYSIHQFMIDLKDGLGLLEQSDLERFDMDRLTNSEQNEN